MLLGKVVNICDELPRVIYHLVKLITDLEFVVLQLSIFKLQADIGNESGNSSEHDTVL